MTGFSIVFSNPWWLLLFIPAIAFTLIPYFRLSKRYRRTRNRITSIVLHLLVMFFSITLMAGIGFQYVVPNTENEIILLVDVSETEEQSCLDRDEFVKRVLKDGRYDNYNIGVVTFGFNQNYAVPLTTDVESIYDLYKAADTPDTSATNLAAALEYTKTLFENPKTGKIVLITDGKETDETARTAISSVSAQGIAIDVAYIRSAYDGNDAQFVGVQMPDYYVSKGENCQIIVSVQSRGENEMTIYMKDNGVAVGEQTVEFTEGNKTKNVTFMHAFGEEGLHELSFSMLVYDNLLEQNDVYTSYYYLEIFNKILILQKEDRSSEALMAKLNENLPPEDQFVFTTATVGTNEVPVRLEELREYDQIIFNNISNADLKLHGYYEGEGKDKVYVSFAEELQKYVRDCGGGLFTVGGSSKLPNTVNAYNYTDMPGSIYQDMLPVRAVEYTPPVAIELIIDRSGSMGESGADGETFLSSAVAGAYAVLDQLEAKDYMGIMTLDSTYDEILPLTPGSQRERIREGINKINDPGGGTEFTASIEKAAQKLWDKKDVAKRHIIIITDGLPGDKPEQYCSAIATAYKDRGVTVSIVLVGAPDENTQEQMWNAVYAVDDLLGYELPKEKMGKVYLASDGAGGVVSGILDDMMAPTITEVVEEPYYPLISNVTSPLVQGVERDDSDRMTVQLGGFYGVEARQSADVVLLGEYNVPIYAQWKYGKGSVGSFMCDLQDTEWSSEFMGNENGQRFIRNVINNLMPMESIRSNEITVKLVEDNYTNTLNVLTDLAEGESIQGEIRFSDDSGDYVISLNPVEGEFVPHPDCYVLVPLSLENNYSTCKFVAKEGGVYEIILTKVKANGTTVTYRMHKSFSYSEEYDINVLETDEELTAKLADWARRGNGSMIADLEDPWEIFAKFVTEFVYVFDPRFLWMILAIILFLLDIAVRKFKFKWPHEIIREYKKKKSSK